MTALMRVLAVAALMVATGTARTYPHPFGSERDQYEPREGRPHPPQLPAEATDHPPEGHRFNIHKKAAEEDPELQVGCGGDLAQEKITHDKPSEAGKNGTSDIAVQPQERSSYFHPGRRAPAVDKNGAPKTRKVRATQPQKRSFYPYSGQRAPVVPYQSVTVWHPAHYQLNRPYYIPVFGIQGKTVIYYPPQPLLLNPGAPFKNPPFQGPAYLPPTSPTTAAPPATTMTYLDNRFNPGEPDVQIEPEQNWGAVSADDQSTSRPPSRPVVPTRRPARPTSRPTTHPPLIRDGSDRNQTDEQSSNGGAASSFNPTFAPSSVSGNVPPPNGPSTCVWAIIACCSTSGDIRYDCFEQRGCPGAFWDNNPCNNDFAKAAIGAALNFYEDDD